MCDCHVHAIPVPLGLGIPSPIAGVILFPDSCHCCTRSPHDFSWFADAMMALPPSLTRWRLTFSVWTMHAQFAVFLLVCSRTPRCILSCLPHYASPLWVACLPYSSIHLSPSRRTALTVPRAAATVNYPSLPPIGHNPFCMGVENVTLHVLLTVVPNAVISYVLHAPSAIPGPKTTPRPIQSARYHTTQFWQPFVHMQFPYKWTCSKSWCAFSVPLEPFDPPPRVDLLDNSHLSCS